jgi:hypothetical protein
MKHPSGSWRRSGTWLFEGAAVIAAVVMSGCGGDDGQPTILDCTGTCSCDADTRTCSCSGGTDCTITGAGEGGVTLVCEGNAECNLACGVGCHVQCPGTAGCVADMGDDSDAVCNGTGHCDYTCRGDCAADCPGSSECIVRCAAGSTCTVTSCAGASLVDCGNGVQACRTPCPAAD